MSSDDSNNSEEQLQIIQEDELMEQEPISLEDLDASDIDDEDGDLILEQKVTINNEVEFKPIALNELSKYILIVHCSTRLL
jgi:hypothetical protein